MDRTQTKAMPTRKLREYVERRADFMRLNVTLDGWGVEYSRGSCPQWTLCIYHESTGEWQTSRIIGRERFALRYAIDLFQHRK